MALFLAAASAWTACGSLSDEVKLCGEIPPDGCPIGRGGTCDDATCAGLYDCVDGAWRLEQTCPGGGGGAGASSGAAGADAGPDGCASVRIDHTGETTGCEPDLQSPDCPVVAAETCAASACLTDCVDFFLCTARGWVAVAYCDEEGQLVVGR